MATKLLFPPHSSLDSYDNARYSNHNASFIGANVSPYGKKTHAENDHHLLAGWTFVKPAAYQWTKVQWCKVAAFHRLGNILQGKVYILSSVLPEQLS